MRYTTEKPPLREEYARMVRQIIRPLGLHLLLEPGRTIIGSAGVLLTRVLYVKQTRGRTFVVVDTLGAGLGETVLIVQGSSARLTPETEKLPVDATIIGIVDRVHVQNQTIFSAREQEPG